ncbi:D-alanine--D-alanine ligase [Parvibium lacunae]|uniref:D-alanine--D-alanine ligase n=1 Tax=Parvibium lacunae TaxID=1888893 RepID=A0A368L1X0_9BURK|nr:D-alanine--D-alanine ligase [Parvibium lacunae]RCS57554.1 D-alanine--D-alanine ligase [Parvibium lacunae]
MSQIDVSQFGKVGVLLGGRSAEREISLLSGNGVLSALQAAGVDAHPFDPGLYSQDTVLSALAAQQFERVFIALHGRWGEDGTLQGALEQMGIPYTGSGVMASAMAMDKVYTKRIWMSHLQTNQTGSDHAPTLTTPRFMLAESLAQLSAAVREIGLPLAVKPAREGSSIGFSCVQQESELAAAWQTAAQHDRDVLVEEFVAGREFTVAILGTGEQARALPIVEIVAPEGNYDYQHKYFTDDTQYLCPAPLSAALTTHIQAMALAAFHALGCSGWARVDVLLREHDQQPYLLEINTSPGMTSHSLVPMAAQAAGLSYQALCLQILASARLQLKPAHDEALS